MEINPRPAPSTQIQVSNCGSTNISVKPCYYSRSCIIPCASQVVLTSVKVITVFSHWRLNWIHYDWDFEVPIMKGSVHNIFDNRAFQISPAIRAHDAGIWSKSESRLFALRTEIRIFSQDSYSLSTKEVLQAFFGSPSHVHLTTQILFINAQWSTQAG